MRDHFAFISGRCVATLALLSVAAAVLTGCGVGTIAAPSAAPAALPVVTGNVMGGETPIVNSVVTLWETDSTNSGYGVTARAIENATWSGQTFTFATGYTCTSNNDFLYVTSTGGDVSGGLSAPIINPNLVLIAALGSCSSFATPTQQSAYFVVVNEVTTVAMAYALGNFTTVVANGNVGTQSVYIGAPATNSGATGSCTGTGTSMTCTAAGLAHAFANAMNMVNSVGSVYTTVPGNSLGSVPQAVINTLGNIVQYCTNSTGGTGSTNCGTFFADATPVAGVAPTDTLSALINIAHFPTNNVGTGTCTGASGGLFCLATAQTAFSPALSAAPHDWSIGIAYNGDTQGSFGYVQYVALDANDNVYIQTSDANTATKLGQAAMSSSGKAIWFNATSANQCLAGGVTTDTTGNAFFSVTAISTTTACTWGIYGYSASTGSLTYQFGPVSGTVCNTSSPTSGNCPGFAGYDSVHPVQSAPNGVAVDRFNNLWYNRKSTACATCVQMLPYSGSNYGTATVSEGATSADWDGGYQLLVDAGGNVYTSTLSASVPDIFVIPNTGTAGSPAYTNTSGFIAVTLASSNFGGVAVDSAGNVWGGINGNQSEFIPTLTSGVITSYSAATTYTSAATGPHSSAFDGHDRLFIPNYSTTGNIYVQVSPAAPGYNASAQNAFIVNPCYVPAGASTCSATAPSSDANAAQVDSTGAVWIAGKGSSGTNPPFLVQIIGPGYPAWPQYSYGKFGVAP